MQDKVISKLLFKSVILFGITLLIFIWGLFPSLVLHSYTNGLYPYLSVVLRWISSLFPYALGDILYLSLVLFVLRLIFQFLKRVKKEGWKKQHKIVVPISTLNFFLILYISFKLLWGLNYARPSISTQLNIPNKKYNVKELVMLGNFFVNKLNQLQPLVNTKQAYTLSQLQEKAVAAYGKMELKNHFFTYNVPSVKSAINGWAVSKIGIEGYYNPLTAEANLNMKLPAWVLPFVTCHEISHQIGVAREDEANLVGYLTSVNSDDINFRYSANYNMLRYILLEIRIKSPADYQVLYQKIDAGIIANFKAENEFWSKYNSDMSGYMSVAFDKFLKLNNQKRGINSYQNIVIWLWNIHQKEL